jgi:hypothetical protein
VEETFLVRFFESQRISEGDPQHSYLFFALRGKGAEIPRDLNNSVHSDIVS